jgi:hypothetical protein
MQKFRHATVLSSEDGRTGARHGPKRYTDILRSSISPSIIKWTDGEKTCVMCMFRVHLPNNYAPTDRYQRFIYQLLLTCPLAAAGGAVSPSCGDAHADGRGSPASSSARVPRRQSSATLTCAD